MAKERVYTWYLEPLDELTNSAFRHHLPAESFSEDRKCEDGEHPLWECSHGFVSFCENSRESKKLDFKTYVKEGEYGKIRRWVKEKHPPIHMSLDLLKQLKFRSKNPVH